MPEIGYHLFVLRPVRLNVDRNAANGAMYGLLLGGLFATADAIASRPLWILLWTGEAAMIAIGAVLTWRRMAMRWLAVAMTLGAIQGGLIGAVYAAGWTLRDFALRWPYVVFPMLAAVLSLVLVSQWREAQQWSEWRQRAAHIRFRDMLLFRHIPDMRAERLERT